MKVEKMSVHISYALETSIISMLFRFWNVCNFQNQGSKCPSLPGLTHWVNPGLPGLGFKPYFGKVGNTGE